MVQRLLVIVLALLLGVQVVRNAAVEALARGSPDTAAHFWSDHPAVELVKGMTQIGVAARERRPVPGDAFGSIYHAAGKAPLAPEPFLVRGVQAQLAGKTPLAIQSFVAAERRDPRSLPAHYFLADAYFKGADSRHGLQEVGVLARLSPNGPASVAPYLAAYARDRSTWPYLRDLFRSSPQIEDTALTALAADARNADAIMALSVHRDGVAKTNWLPALLKSLVTAGDYGRARAIWAQTSGVAPPSRASIFDAGFSQPTPPAPFNWTLISSGVGLSERQPGGRLHVIYYGAQDGLLASQLLALPPGQYQISMKVGGNLAQSRALTWSIRCDKAQAPISAMPVDVLATRPWAFAVPASCNAQWLELSGVSSDIAHQSEITIANLKLASGQPHA